MDTLIDDLERLAEMYIDDPLGSQLLPVAIAALRAGKVDPATAFELSLLADCENAAGRVSVGSLLQQASERLKQQPSASGNVRIPPGRLH